MLTLLKELQSIVDERELDVSTSIAISESADQYLGQLYAKLGNRHRTLSQMDINPADLAKVLSGFRVIGKSDLRNGFADISKPKMLLKFLNDVNEVGQEREFGEDMNSLVKADDRLREIALAAPSFINQYEEMLTKLADDPEDDQTRETILRDINKMRVFFEQIRNKLKTHLNKQVSTSLNPT